MLIEKKLFINLSLLEFEVLLLEKSLIKSSYHYQLYVCVPIGVELVSSDLTDMHANYCGSNTTIIHTRISSSLVRFILWEEGGGVHY